MRCGSLDYNRRPRARQTKSFLHLRIGSLFHIIKISGNKNADSGCDPSSMYFKHVSAISAQNLNQMYSAKWLHGQVGTRRNGRPAEWLKSCSGKFGRIMIYTVCEGWRCTALGTSNNQKKWTKIFNLPWISLGTMRKKNLWHFSVRWRQSNTENELMPYIRRSSSIIYNCSSLLLIS